MFEAIAVVLTRLAATRPLLVELEDLHWAGPATVALLEDLTRTLAGHPILIVATYREEELERGHPLRTFGAGCCAKGWSTGSRSARSRCARSRRRSCRSSPKRSAASVARELHARTDGNAFFLSELVRDRAERAAADGLAATRRRRRLHETIAARLGRLSEARARWRRSRR